MQIFVSRYPYFGHDGKMIRGEPHVLRITEHPIAHDGSPVNKDVIDPALSRLVVLKAIVGTFRTKSRVLGDHTGIFHHIIDGVDGTITGLGI